MPRYKGIGVMTGTSMDGVDLAFCQFEEKQGRWTWKIKTSACVSFPKALKILLSHLNSGTAEEYAKLHAAFGHFLGKTIKNFIIKNKLKPQFAACHGQTIFHQPEKGFTAQIGDGEVISSYLNCPVITNFRAKDVAMGGQGAPLVPMGEKHLFPTENIFLNLGGICNLTYARAAFDVGPCNLVLNSFAKLWGKSFDRDGKMASTGKVNHTLLKEINSLPWYRKNPPKSLGSEWVEKTFMPLLLSQRASPRDCMRTFCEHLAFQIASALKKQKAGSGTILITGGGAKNKFLMTRIQTHLNPLGISVNRNLPLELVDNKEALIFAFLGLLRLLGKENTLHHLTGAKNSTSSGTISGGKFWNK